MSNDEIRKYINNKETHEKDKVFLMYDGDISTVVDRLLQIDDAEKLISTPCIELWFLLHFKNQTTEIDCKECIQYLSNRIQYTKGKISSGLRQHLISKKKGAIKRAKALTSKNPGSTIYVFIEHLEAVKQ